MIEKIIDFCARQKFLVLSFVFVAIVASVWSVKNIPLDAIPDLSDTQVIVYSRWDRSPDLIEDQITYPIVSALLGIPGVKAIRGASDFGFSYVYVIFKDGTDLYWARSRVLEYLSKISSELPQGAKTELGPDATGVGWVLQYALVDTSGKHDLGELRSFQDWHLRYWLQSVPGVAEVAAQGGFVKQYQITVDPRKLLAYNIPITKVIEAVRQGNQETSGRLVEFTGAEYMIRGRGYAKSIEDFEKIVIARDDALGAPITIKDIGHVAIGGDIRRGVLDLNGEGDVVGGTVVMRQGENALKVIDAVKAKLKETQSALPDGVRVEITYDRSDLILRAIDNLKKQLLEEMIIVSIVILVFLWHFPSAFIPILTIPIAVLLSFIPLLGLKLTSNIMSLAGIAISIGVLVDGAIVQMENVYKRLEEWEANGRKENPQDVTLKALKEVAPSIFFALLVIAVSFLPIFTLLDQEGRLFKPLAWSKTFAMAIAAILVVTLNPALRLLFVRTKPFAGRPKWLMSLGNSLFVGRFYAEEKHPVSKVLFKVYEPVCRFVLKHTTATLVAAFLLMASTVPIFLKLGSEFMPPLWEGQILYMPITMPGISVTEAQKLLQTQDKILKQFPEVDKVFGKIGRIESSTDPAPFSMAETVVLLKPESQWRVVNGHRLKHDQLIAEMDQALKIPGTTNAWTMPIKNRIDMLSTGIRTPIGIKVLGSNFQEIDKIGMQLEAMLKDIPGTRSVFAERTQGGYFLDFDLNRDRLAQYQLSVADAQTTIQSAIGGENITTTIEGRERYNVNVRYPRALRDDLDDLKRVLIVTPSGAQIPLGEVANIVVRTGPSMIRNENGMLAGYVYVDVAGRDIGSYVKEAKKIVQQQLKVPQGYSLIWSGQYENMLRVRERLKIVIPLTLFIIVLLLYMNTKSWVKTGIVLLAVPFSLVGAFWLLWALDYNLSIAVWVGMIALMGLDAETGVLMLLFLDISYKDAVSRGAMKSKNDLHEAVVHGAVRRVRPKMMTVMAALLGLLPIMFSHGAGADVMKRIAAPMVGGLISSFALELLVYPVVFFLWKWHFEMKRRIVQ
ncbi:MAG: efflux RND transporter permease subunit [Candidatus Omnitrophica bacterium]|nr:efflux RND transporter permease subunit [Candidatus Omnitrophota bacterium]